MVLRASREGWGREGGVKGVGGERGFLDAVLRGFERGREGVRERNREVRRAVEVHLANSLILTLMTSFLTMWTGLSYI